MRSDGLWLDTEDVAFFAGALALLAELVKQRGQLIPPEVVEAQRKLNQFLKSRIDVLGDTTLRPPAGWLLDADVVDVSAAAEQLGVTPDAVRKACRGGRFKRVAQKELGRWMIPAADVVRVRSE
ncbi:hypothetical protein ACJH6H_26530 [Mycobacterium sp. SMC-21]|uniref:hypothetical protein n=1 Tax=Mycobacterium sp. SMC-21 TaxID=3381632 RepID=UPI00387688A0